MKKFSLAMLLALGFLALSTNNLVFAQDDVELEDEGAALDEEASALEDTTAAVGEEEAVLDETEGIATDEEATLTEDADISNDELQLEQELLALDAEDSGIATNTIDTTLAAIAPTSEAAPEEVGLAEEAGTPAEVIAVATVTAPTDAQVAQAAGLTSAQIAQNRSIKAGLVAPKALKPSAKPSIVTAINDVIAIVGHIKGRVFDPSKTPDVNSDAKFPTKSSRCTVLFKDAAVMLIDAAVALKPNAPAAGKQMGKVDTYKLQISTKLEAAGVKIRAAIKEGKLDAINAVIAGVAPTISGFLQSIPDLGPLNTIINPIKDPLKKVGEVLGALSPIFQNCSKLEELKDELKTIDLSDLPTE